MAMITKLPTKGILIAPTYMHSALRLAYLKDGQGTYGLSIVSLSTFLKKYQGVEERDDIEVLLEYRLCLQEMACPIYQNIVTSLDFLKQCFSFIEDMKFYDIDVKDLPQTTKAQLEMKQILSALYSIPTKQESILFALENIKESTLRNVFILETYYTLREERILQVLQDAHATRITFEKTREYAQFYHAMNKRKEVEAMAQQIIREKQKSEDINIIVCDTSYTSLISQVFHRYKIPNTIMKETCVSMITRRFVLLLQYYIEPSTKILLELIACNTFKASYLQDLVNYLQIFEMRLEQPFNHVQTNDKGSELLPVKEIAQLRMMEERAQLAKNEIWPYLQTLQQLNSIKDVFQHIDKIVSSTIKASDIKHIQTLKQLHSLIITIIDDLHHKEDLEFAIDILSTIEENATNKRLQGCLISSLHAPLLPRKVTYVVGCTQKNYPATPSLRGLFDEAYVKEIQNYPSMRMRYDHHMKQMNHILHMSENLYVSYPSGNYDGKSNEAALEMEQYLDMPVQPYPLYEQYQRVSSRHQIQRESAISLFVKEGVLPGSISSFERYMRCPFSYFLAYGLRLKEPIDHQFTPNRIGTLIHYIMEIIVTKYQKEYVHVSLEEVETMLHEELSIMANMYPTFRPMLYITKKRMLHSIQNNLTYLKDMEEHAHLTSCISEHEFWWDLPLASDLNMQLHGFIDRIDTSNGYARIIDYKSSTKSLPEKEVFAGIKLQLLTYALHVEEQTGKQILGTYYYSLKQENIQMIAGSMKRRPVEYHASSLEDYALLAHASHKLQGWTTSNDVDIIDDDGTHIYSVRQNKDGCIAARKTYELSLIREHIMEIYRQIGERILAGNIACEPIMEACMFCPYKEICRYNGYPRALAPLVEVDASIYKGGA